MTKIPAAWHWPYLILLLLFYAPLMYGAVVTLYRLVAVLLSCGKLFNQFELTIYPLQLDGSGGLGKFGDYLVGGVLGTTLIGAAAVANSIAVHFPQTAVDFSRPDILVLGILYIVLTPMMFIYWMWSPHQAMLRARARFLMPLSQEYQLVLPQTILAGENDSAAIKARTERLEEIRKQYDLIESSFPVWPLALNAIRSLITTASLPSLSSFLVLLLPNLPQRLMDFIKQWK
jgi:hypothetical protein